MKIWHLGLLSVASLLVTAALTLASQKENQPPERAPSPPVVYSGPVASVYWLEHGTTARGYTLKDEQDAPQSLSVVAGIADSITGRVHEGWVILEVGRQVVLVPREKVISLKFKDRQN